MRIAPLCLLALFACDSAKDDAATSGAAADLPPLTMAVNTVALRAILTHQPPAGSADEVQSWLPKDGEMFAVVKAEIGHNQCKDGDRLEGKDVSLSIGADKFAPVGGGPTDKLICVDCAISEKLTCEAGRSAASAHFYVFALQADADVAKASFKYRDMEQPLASATISDKRDDDQIDIKIKAKRDEIAAMKKKLENMPSESAGRLVLAEIEEIEATIAELEKKKARSKSGGRRR
jgi:hypothetical protein